MDHEIGLQFRGAEFDGNDFVVPDNDIEYPAAADADIGSSFGRDRRNGVQDLQRSAAEGTVNSKRGVHIRQLLQFLDDVDRDALDFAGLWGNDPVHGFRAAVFHMLSPFLSEFVTACNHQLMNSIARTKRVCNTQNS